MIYTSCFGYHYPRSVSIARFNPKGYTGEHYPQLAPPIWLLNQYNRGKVSDEDYEVLYKSFVLDKLDPKQVYLDLMGKVLMCYEPKGCFCHRHIAAKWLADAVHEAVKEIP